MSKGTMMTRQKYCVLCQFRRKDDMGTWCINVRKQHITKAMETCPRLRPFDKHKAQKEPVSK
jgi:hypothetical protein